MANMEELKSLKTGISDCFEVIKKDAAEDVVIDSFDLDGESLRTPKLHSKWLGILSEEAIRLKQLQNFQKKLLLERWKYYNGKQPDKYYIDHGAINDKILKTDINLYLDADDVLIIIKEIVEIQDQAVDFLEKTIKEISSRTFHIKSAIDWRKFESGN